MSQEKQEKLNAVAGRIAALLAEYKKHRFAGIASILGCEYVILDTALVRGVLQVRVTAMGNKDALYYRLPCSLEAALLLEAELAATLEQLKRRKEQP